LVWYKKKEISFSTSTSIARRKEEDKKYEVHINLRPARIQHEIEDNLRRLKTDRIDLYLQHWQKSITKAEDAMAEL